MKLYLIILYFIMFPFKGISQNDVQTQKYNGFEIYLTENFVRNKKSFLSLSKKEQRKLTRQYKNKGLKNIPVSLCLNYLDLDKVILKEEPFLSFDDIEFYSSSDYVIKLTDIGKKKLESLKGSISVHGKPFVIVANDKKILGAWFWSIQSSSVCDRVYSQISSNIDYIKLSFNICGPDPRIKTKFLTELTEF